MHEKSKEKYLTEQIRRHLRQESKTKKFIVQTLIDFQNNLLKRIKSSDGSHSEILSMQYAQSDNFIIPRHYVKNREAQKGFTIDTRNQLQPLENVTEEQSNNELNMAQETTNSPRNYRTTPVEKSVETLSSSTGPAHNNFVSSEINNCVNNIRGYEKRMLKKHRNNLRKLQKNY